METSELFSCSDWLLFISVIMQCKCGCGGETRYDREFVWGHKSPTVRPLVACNLCACGCGELTRGIWCKGHCNRKPPKERTVCPCGCGELAAIGHTFLAGHNQKTDAGRQKKREMLESLWKEHPEKFAERVVWSTGLTKETDVRLAEHSKRMSASYTPEKREAYRTYAKENAIHIRMGVGQTGSLAPNWKGGVTTVHQRVRSDTELHRLWRFPILKRDSFVCVACGSHKKIEVHHDDERMAEIIGRFLPADVSTRELFWDEKLAIIRDVVKYHVKNAVSGVTLCEDCHREIHRMEAADIDD